MYHGETPLALISPPPLPYMAISHNYRPQRSWAKVMFLQASVILLTGGCLPQCMLRYTPPRSRHPPWEQIPPWEQTPPRSRHTPQTKYTPLEADSGIRSMSGRYASYWNAFLFVMGNYRKFMEFF